jgi:surfactin synthase thioesterase subunit
VSCPITVLTGDNDPKTTLDEANAWARHTTAAYELRMFAGAHFFLTQHVDAINAMLSKHFQAQRAGIAS